MSDLADDLRLRQIDVLGVYTGALVALDLAAARAELVRRLVLVGVPSVEALKTIRQPTLVMRAQLEEEAGVARLKAALPNGKFVDIADYAGDLFDAAPKTLATQIGEFLTG